MTSPLAIKCKHNYSTKQNIIRTDDTVSSKIVSSSSTTTTYVSFSTVIMQKYEKLEKIGEGKMKTQVMKLCFVAPFLLLCAGTYGTVFKAKNKETGEIVALKRVRLDDDDEVKKDNHIRTFKKLLLELLLQSA